MYDIETKRFILRMLKMTDKEEVFNILKNPNVTKTLNMQNVEKLSDAEALMEDYFEEYKAGNKYPFAIIDKATKKFLGVFLIKLDLYDEDCYESTIYLSENVWNKGICTEVLPYMTEFAFSEIKTGNFRCFVMEKNIASAKSLEKCGFMLEKIFDVDGIDGKILSYLKINTSKQQKI